MKNLFKYSNPNWDEVLTEQGGYLPCSGNTRRSVLFALLKKKYVNRKYTAIYDWQTEFDLLKKEIEIDFGINNKIYKQLTRIERYGYPKECPAMKFFNNLIIF